MLRRHVTRALKVCRTVAAGALDLTEGACVLAGAALEGYCEGVREAELVRRGWNEHALDSVGVGYHTLRACVYYAERSRSSTLLGRGFREGQAVYHQMRVLNEGAKRPYDVAVH